MSKHFKPSNEPKHCRRSLGENYWCCYKISDYRFLSMDACLIQNVICLNKFLIKYLNNKTLHFAIRLKVTVMLLSSVTSFQFFFMRQKPHLFLTPGLKTYFYINLIPKVIYIMSSPYPSLVLYLKLFLPFTLCTVGITANAYFVNFSLLTSELASRCWFSLCQRFIHIEKECFLLL